MNAKLAGLLSSLAVLGFGTWMLTGPADATPGEIHKVWVCKYVQKPGTNEVIKDGKNPIAVDSAATIGESFKDGQFLSVVIDVVTDANTSHPGNEYTGSMTCDLTPPSSSPPPPTST